MAVGWVLAVYALTALATAALGVVSWRRRGSAPIAAPALAVAAAGLTWWSAADAAVVADGSQVGKEATLLTVFPAVGVAVTGFYVMARALADLRWRPTRRVLAGLGAYPALVAVICLTNPLHHLFVTSVRPRPVGGWVDWGPGPLFWLHTGISYLLLGLAGVVMVRTWRHTGRLHRRQLELVLAAAAVPFVGNVASLTGQVGADLPEFTALLFTVTAALDAFAAFRLGLMRLVPVARGLVLDRLADAVVVVGPDQRVLDVNAAGADLLRRLVPGLPPALAGVRAADIVRRHGIPTPLRDGEYSVRAGDEDLVLDVRVSPLSDHRGGSLGGAVVIRDVTAVHAQQAALADANERLRSQLVTIDRLRGDLAEQATRDHLTGLHNRRHLVAALDRALADAADRRSELAVVLFDIDHFKSINDTYGHAVGDDVLVATARVLADAVRAGDTIARYGGEEFIVLLPGTTVEQARVRAEECRSLCAELVVDSRFGPVRTTISAGVAGTAETGPDAIALLQAADEALYAAKAAGRDRVVVAG